MPRSVESVDADAPYLPLIDSVEFQPVFIMGHARSGTTVLYHILERTGCFNCVRVYHLLKESELLANQQRNREAQARLELDAVFASPGMKTRRFDNVPVGTNVPEEYWYVLDRYSRRPSVSDRNLQVLVRFCKKVQYLSDPSKTLLLKNPWDYANFVYLQQAFPNAKFIFNHRHPIPILNSQLRAIQQNWREGNDYLSMLSDTYRRLHENRWLVQFMRWITLPDRQRQPMLSLLTNRMAKLEGNYQRHFPELPKECRISVRYEDLCQDPELTIGKILAFLGEQPLEPLDYRSMIQPRPPELLPAVEQARDRISRRLQFMLEAHGYPLD